MDGIKDPETTIDGHVGDSTPSLNSQSNPLGVMTAMRTVPPPHRPIPVRAKSEDPRAMSRGSSFTFKTQAENSASKPSHAPAPPPVPPIPSTSSEQQPLSTKRETAAEAFDKAIRRMENVSDNSQASQLHSDDEAFNTVYGPPDPSTIASPSYGTNVFSATGASPVWNPGARYTLSPPPRGGAISPYQGFLGGADYQTLPPSLYPHYAFQDPHSQQIPHAQQPFYQGAPPGFVLPTSPHLGPTSPGSPQMAAAYQMSTVVSPSPHSYYYQPTVTSPYLTPLSPSPQSPMLTQHHLHSVPSHRPTPPPQQGNPGMMIPHHQGYGTQEQMARPGPTSVSQAREGSSNSQKPLSSISPPLLQHQQQPQNPIHSSYNIYQSYQPLHIPQVTPTNVVQNPYQPNTIHQHQHQQNPVDFRFNSQPYHAIGRATSPPVPGSPVTFPPYQMLTQAPYTPLSPLSPSLGPVPLSPGPVYQRQPTAVKVETAPSHPARQQPLARGHLAQAKLRGAIFDSETPLDGELIDKRKIRSALPKPPLHSEFAMWVGNLPSDSSHTELWSFFTSRPPPPNHPLVPVEAFQNGSSDMNPSGVESIHLISRSNCAFVNYISPAHLEQGIHSCHGVPLRARDPRCKPLVCRVRKREDDAKSGVGAQRGSGMHRHWVAERKARGLPVEQTSEQQIATTSASLSMARSISQTAGTVERQITTAAKRSSGSTTHSGSTASTTSSFLGRNFPMRYFILKSHTEDDLLLSVKRGKWATQSHNEVVLDQAFRTSKVVYLIFGANKSGEFFGYARMTSPILAGQNRMSWTVRGDENTSSVRSSAIPEDSAQDFTSPPLLLSPSEHRPPNTSPGVITPQVTPSGIPNVNPASIPAFRQSEPLPPKAAPESGTDQRSSTAPDYFDRPTLERSLSDTQAPLPTSSLSTSSESKPTPTAVEAKELWNPALPAEERNAKLENIDEEVTELGKKLDKAWGRPFDVEWLKVERLPFNRTRHLRNPWNGSGREVKISRDGTELEPGVGEALLREFDKVGLGYPSPPAQGFQAISSMGYPHRPPMPSGLPLSIGSPPFSPSLS
ncbi:hypothetical protein BT69DRAFT_1146492 [Atractiella rhizophila]|nr:hypothetical protein BT69DRAFT_1146492 [Atractiella rhizophila]